MFHRIDIVRLKFFSAALSLAGCVTPYQPAGISGGYSDTKVGENIYLVSFQGNGFTSYSTVHSLALQRASEVCESRDFNDFDLIGKEGSTSTDRTPDQYNCRSSGSVYGSTYSGATNCSNSGGYTISKHAISILVRCVGGEGEKRIKALVDRREKEKRGQQCSQGDSVICGMIAYEKLQAGDVAQATDFARRACGASDKLGCMVLGSVGSAALQRGDDKTAESELKFSCEHGYELSCTSMGAFSAKHGNGKEAFRYYTTACMLNDPLGCQLLGQMTQDQTKASQHLEKAKTLYAQQCKEKNNEFACKQLIDLNAAH